MDFGISIEIDMEANIKSSLIQGVSDKLEQFFSDRGYGDGIQHYNIGCVCIKTMPGMEEWFKKRKPRYRECEIIKKIDGSVIEWRNVFSYDIKMDYEEYEYFVKSSDKESRELLTSKILESVSNLDALPKKVKDFDKEKFKADLELVCLNLKNSK